MELNYVIGIKNNAGPDAITQELNLDSQQKPRYIAAWLGNFGASNAYILAGNLSLSECQSRLERGLVDVLLAVSGTGPVYRELPDDVHNLTIFFEAENTSGQTEVVQIKISDKRIVSG